MPLGGKSSDKKISPEHSPGRSLVYHIPIERKLTFFVILLFQDVVYALAHATGKTGRFTLIESWRNNERLLAPQEHPLKVSNTPINIMTQKLR